MKVTVSPALILVVELESVFTPGSRISEEGRRGKKLHGGKNGIESIGLLNEVQHTN